MTCQPVQAFRRAVSVLLAVVALLATDSQAAGQRRMLRIRERGALVCGVAPLVAGFAQVDGQGRYRGLDVDVCRAVSAAVFGSPDKVRYEQASSVEQFQRTPD